jgi:hypothetical protein
VAAVVAHVNQKAGEWQLLGKMVESGVLYDDLGPEHVERAGVWAAENGQLDCAARIVSSAAAAAAAAAAGGHAADVHGQSYHEASGCMLCLLYSNIHSNHPCTSLMHMLP